MKIHQILSASVLFGLALGAQAQTGVPEPSAPVSGPVVASDPVVNLTALNDRLARIEAQSQGQGLLALLAQVQELKAEVARLRGAQDEIVHAQQQADIRQKALFADLDDRQKELKQAVANLDTRQKKTLELQSNLNDQIQELASKPAPSQGDAMRLQRAQSLTVATAPVVLDPEAEAKAYELALNQFKTGNYSNAVDAFNAFLKVFPNGNFAPNAQYWLGLTYLAQADYRNAAAAQQRLLKDFPQSHKVPDAMVSLARSQIQLGEVELARSTLEQVVARYPVTTAADIARKLLALAK